MGAVRSIGALLRVGLQLVCAAQLAAANAAATEPPPRLCTGFNEETKDWELVGPIAAHVQEQSCPRGSAYLRVALPTGALRFGARIPVRGTCCPLPEGVLTDQHVWETNRCPDDHVATGARASRQVSYEGDNWQPAIAEWERIDHFIRCTKVDTARFHVGVPAEALTIGFHDDFNRIIWSGAYTSESRIPLGLRTGVTRNGRLGAALGGCIGYPWGALLTGKVHKYCGFEFRVLEYTGAPNDPPAGTPVRMVPECMSVDDPLSPAAKCIPYPGRAASF